MYNRYNNIEKFITDSRELIIDNNSEVYISSRENYDIVVDLDNRIDEFEKLRPHIAFVAEHICELDNKAQRFHQMNHKEKQFTYELSIIHIEKTNIIRFEYWGTLENTVFDVIFEHKDNKFCLKNFGMIDNIHADWDK